MDGATVGLTIRLAAATTIVLLGFGLPLAYWLATSRARWKGLVEAAVGLPIVLPPTVLGYYLLTSMSPRSPLGGGIATLLGHPLPFSFAGLLVGSVISNLPFAVQPMAAGFASVDRRLIEAAWCLGASRFSAFLRVACRLAWPGILTGLILAFTHTIGEFGVVLMIGGNIPGETRTLSIAIYDDVQALDYDSAGRASALLVAVSFAALAAVYLLRRRTG